MSHAPLSRRTFLQTSAALAGAATLQGQSPSLAPPKEEPSLVVFFLNGGPSGLFNSAGSFLDSGAFGVRPANVKDLGRGLVVDAGSLGSLPPQSLARMAAVNFQHGHYRHDLARAAMLQTGHRSNLLLLAGAMPARAAIRCAVVNSLGFPVGASLECPAEEGATFTRVMDFPSLDAHLKRAAAFDPREAASAYGLPSGLQAIADTPSTFLATEMLVRGGASVVFSQPAYLGRPDRQFDTHKDLGGVLDRQIMAQLIPHLRVFLQRMDALPHRNIVVALFGEFSRTVQASDHEPGGTATVIGKYVRCGSAGPQRANGSVPANTPGPGGLWSFLAGALRLEDHPFGENPQPELLRLAEA